MVITSKKNLKAYALFMIWPFFALIYAIINYKENYAKNIVWLFTCFYGYTFVIAPEIDANRYKEYFLRYHEGGVSLPDFLLGLINGKYARGDYFEPLLSYIIAQFTSDHRVLFLMFAFVFGYFFSRSIWLLIEYSGGKLKPLSSVLMIFLIMTLPFWYINGVRFYTACIIFCYGALGYYLKGNRKYILLIALTPLVHVSFFLPLGLFLINLFFKLNRITYIVAFVFAAFLSSFDINMFLQYAYLLEGNAALSYRVGAYTHEQVLEQYFDESSRSWFMQLKDDFVIYINVIIVLFLLIFKYDNIKNYKLDPLLSLGIIIFSSTAILQVIPSMQRFFTLSSYILTATFLIFYQKNKSNFWINLSSPVYGFFMIFLSVIEFRVGWMTMNITLLFSNPFFAPFFDNTISILDIYYGNAF